MRSQRLLNPSAVLVGLLFVLSACAQPTRVRVGDLTVENHLDRPVALAAAWQDVEQSQYGSLEILLPRDGAEVALDERQPLPVGTRIEFATRGEGYVALLERNGVLAGDLLPAVFESASAEIRTSCSAHLRYRMGSLPEDSGGLEPAQLEWVYPGGAVHLVLVEGEGGGLRLERR